MGLPEQAEGSGVLAEANEHQAVARPIPFPMPVQVLVQGGAWNDPTQNQTWYGSSQPIEGVRRHPNPIRSSEENGCPVRPSRVEAEARPQVLPDRSTVPRNRMELQARH